MAYQETTSRSWFSRLGDSFGGIILGVVLLIGATVLLYWNEGRTVKTGDAIGEAQRAVVTLTDISRLDPAMEGKLVHASGRAETQDLLRDPIFGAEQVALKLQRTVEYYQWEENTRQETRKKLGGGEETVTTYTYEKKWSASPVDSAGFKDPNYTGINELLTQVEEGKWLAPKVSFGAYTLPESFKNAISGEQPLAVTLTYEQKRELGKMITVPLRYGRSPGAPTPSFRETVYTANYVHARDNVVYFGADPNSPRVGDVRVTFTQTPPAQVTLVAKVVGGSFEPFVASNGNKFSRLAMGEQSAAAMFEGAQSENMLIAWVLRVVGVLLLIAGWRAILGPLPVIADVVPLLGSIVGAGVGLVATLLGLSWGLIVIAAGIMARPLLAVGLLVAAAAMVAFLYYRSRRKAALPQPPAAA